MKNSYVQRAEVVSEIHDEWDFEFGPPIFIKNDDPVAPNAIRFRYLALGPEGIKLADSFDCFCNVFSWQANCAFLIQAVPECIHGIYASVFDDVAENYPDRLI